MIQNLRQLDLNLLLVFDALMQEQKLSRAAERLHMSQPAVSNALMRLRAQLGEPLFTRTARGMLPTPQAQQIHGHVRQALHLLQLGLGPQHAFDGNAEHHFRICMNDYGQMALLPALLAALRNSAPGVQLTVQGDDAATIPTRLATGELDLAIDYLSFDAPDLCYQALLEEELVVIGRAGHPAFEGGLTTESYQSSPHVAVLPRGVRGSPLEIVLGSAKLRRKIQLYLPHYVPIPALVASSDLIGTVPRRQAVQSGLAQLLEIAPLPLPAPPIQVSLIWHRQQEAAPGLAWLRKLITEVVRNLPMA